MGTKLALVAVAVLCALSVLMRISRQRLRLLRRPKATRSTCWHHIWWTDTKWVLITTIARCWHLTP